MNAGSKKRALLLHETPSTDLNLSGGLVTVSQGMICHGN